MTDLASEQVARLLMPHAKSAVVADLMLQKASLDRQQVSLGAAPTDNVARKYIKKDLFKTLSVVSHVGTNPEVLSAYAADTRVATRRALIGNPSTPYATIKALAFWALEREDDSAPNALARLDGFDVVEVLAAHPVGRHYFHSSAYRCTTMAHAIADTGDRALIEQAVSFGYIPLNAQLALYVNEQISPAITATEILALAPDQHDHIAEVLVQSPEFCSLEASEIIAASTVYHYRVAHSKFTMLAPGAAENLMRSENKEIVSLALRSGVRGSLVTERINQGDCDDIALILDYAGSDLARSDIKLIFKRIPTFNEGLSPQFVRALTDLLGKTSYRIRSNDLLDAFRAVGLNLTHPWLLGSFPANQPALGEITALVDNPGMAFSHTVSRYASRNSFMVSTPTSASREETENVLLRILPEVVEKPWMDEQAGLISAGVVAHLLSNRQSAGWLTDKLLAHFGDDTGCWESALSLLGGWSDSLESLLETTLAINGLEMPEPPEPEVPAEPTPPSTVQLALI